MFVPVDCSQCGKPFQVPEAAIGKPTACPWCQAAVLALPVGRSTLAGTVPAATKEPEAANGNLAVSEDGKLEELPPKGRESIPLTEPLSLDDEPLPPPPPSQLKPAKPVRGPLAWAVFGLLVVLASVLTLALLQRKQGHLASLEWRRFTPPDGSCEIDLLGRAAEADSEAERGERQYISEGWYSGTSTWIGWGTLTPVQAQEATAKDGWVQYRKLFFDKERERLKDKFGGSVVRDATIGQDPLTVEVRLDGGKKGRLIERMIVMPKGANPRVYFIGMAGKRLDFEGAEVKRLFDSFRASD